MSFWFHFSKACRFNIYINECLKIWPHQASWKYRYHGYLTKIRDVSKYTVRLDFLDIHAHIMDSHSFRSHEHMLNERLQEITHRIKLFIVLRYYLYAVRTDAGKCTSSMKENLIVFFII